MEERTRLLVRQRAGNRCEYCGLAEAQSPVAKLQIEHIVPRKHGGTNDPRNLAPACIDRNLHKGANLTGIDPEMGRVVELFNPRTQQWSDHFAWDAVFVVGSTAVGRTTIRVSQMNAEDRIQSRLAWLQNPARAVAAVRCGRWASSSAVPSSCAVSTSTPFTRNARVIARGTCTSI